MKGLLELEESVEDSKPKNNLVLVDCLNFAFRFKHRGMVDFAAEFLRTISSFAKSYSARTVILLADHKYSAYRRNLSPGYKAGRKEAYKDQTPEEKEKAELFFEGYEKALELAKTMYPLLRLEFVEADDLAGYIVKKLSPNYDHTWLISSDGDWDLLLKEDVSRFSFVTRVEYTLDNFFEYHNCDSPEEFVSIKVLAGDSGDSIVGIEGVGIKKAYNLVKQYGTAVDLYNSIPIQDTPKLQERVNNSGDLILINYELIDLLSFCEEAINFPNGENLEYVNTFLKGI